ncbi:MAG: hypothetical protein M1819_005902 [Sarea resinae]|nr:MAG: hypothetical protein M1819_005902 [Sarea resinae]
MAIEGSTEHVIHSSFDRVITRKGDTAVKSGPDVRASEAITLQFIAQNTDIPVPRILSEPVTRDGITSFTMEYVDGQPLQDLWPDLTDEHKLTIQSQLRKIVNELRAIKGACIGALNQGTAIDCRRTIYEGGPFLDESEFNNFIVSDMVTAVPEIFRDMVRHRLRADHAIVFTHGDFTPRNIMVKDGLVAAVIDWEYAGFYPEYWEYVKSLRSSLGFQDFMHNVFPESYEEEFVTDQFLSRFRRHQ